MISWPLVTMVHFPPPLVTRHVDVAVGVVGLRQGEQGAHRGDGDADQDQRGEDRHPDLERRVAVGLPGDCLAPVAVREDHPADRRRHEHEHDAGDQEHRPLEVLDLLGVVARRLPGVLRSVLGAPSEEGATDHHGGRNDHKPDPSAHARHRTEAPAETTSHGTSTSIWAPSTPGTKNA
jgi:hypothetical protein